MGERKGVLAVALLQRGALPQAAFELLTAGRAIAEAGREPLCAAILGAKAGDAAKELIERGADKVFVIESPALENFNGELHAKAVAELVEKENFAKILIPGSVAGRALGAALSVRLKAGLAADASALAVNGLGLKATRSQYGGNVVAEVVIKAPVQIATVQAMAFPRAEKQAGRSGETVKVPFEPSVSRVEFVFFKAEEGGEIDLGAAERIVSGGRGLGGPEGFNAIRELARAIGGAVGASRAVVDSGWIPYRHQVGLTGRAVRPKLYIACGISGQIQHLAGMSSSGTVVAINSDPDCPMMQLASLSVVGDAKEIVPLVVAEIKKRR